MSLLQQDCKSGLRVNVASLHDMLLCVASCSSATCKSAPRFGQARLSRRRRDTARRRSVLGEHGMRVGFTCPARATCDLRIVVAKLPDMRVDVARRECEVHVDIASLYDLLCVCDAHSASNTRDDLRIDIVTCA
ncbi:hypothetical protein RI054_10g51630 [Pseudoscourfieldia marina]